MSERITMKKLLALVEEMNGREAEWIECETNGQVTRESVPGRYHLGAAYGMYRLEQYASKEGGTRDITGFGSARETFERIWIYRRRKG
jgi:hypothetical protein